MTRHQPAERNLSKRIEQLRFVYLFMSRWILLALLALVVTVNRASADEPPPPGKPVPVVTEPYWIADLPAPGKTVTASDLDGDGRVEVIALTSNGRLVAWDAFGAPFTSPTAMPPTATATPKAQFAFSTTLASSQNVVTATLTALDGNRQAAQLVRRVSDARGFDLWPADDGSSALVGDDEGLTLWRVGGQSLRFATRGRPSSAWLGRLTPDGPVVAVALVGNQIKVFGASSDMIREGVLWRVPRPSNDVQTSQEEENAQSLDKTGRKWWAFGSGETTHLIRNDGQAITVQTPGPVTHVKLGDLNGDGVGEVVVSLDDGRVAAMTTDARILWQLPAGPQVLRLDVRDLDGSGSDQVLILDASPALRLYKGNGQEISHLELPYPVIRHIVADLNNDGKPEIAVATSSENEDDKAGAVVVTDAHGNELWQRKQGPSDWIAPLRSGGKVRALASDNGDEGLVAYSPEGKLLWRYTAIGALYYDPADLRGDGVDGVLVSSKVRGPMTALDGDGDEVWKFEPSSKIWMNTTWAITTAHGVRGIYESWYTLGAGDNPEQSFVSRLDSATGKEVWRLRVPQTVYVVQAADTDGDGQAEIWAFTWPGTYRLDAETGDYMQVSEAKWSNSGYFRVTQLDGSGLDQTVFFDPNGVEAHGLVAEQPPWAGVMRVEAGQAGLTDISLSNLLDPGKGSVVSVTLAISLPVAGRWDAVSLAARDEQSGRLLWTTTSLGPWDAGQQRAYRLGVCDDVYSLTLTGTLMIPAYTPPSVTLLEGERYGYRLPLNTAHVVTGTLEVLRPGSQTWETVATRVIPPGSSGEWEVAPFGLWDSEKQAQARFAVDDGIHSGVLASLTGPQVGAQPALQVQVGRSDYRFSGQLRDPHAVTLTIDLFDPIPGGSLLGRGSWVNAATVVVPAGGGAFATQVDSFYDAFDVGHNTRYRVWADDGTRRDVWTQQELPPIAGFPWWSYLIILGLVVGAGSSAVTAYLRQREARRLAYEMHVARAIQESLMPEVVPSIPGLDIAGGSTPAFEVGGDFFGYYRRENNSLGVAVGDVSGKGLPAALLMAVSVGILAAEANRTTEPGDVLGHIDSVLQDYTRRNRLNTALCYLMVTQNESWFCVSAVNAGGISPLVRRADGRIEWLDAHGLPLGIPDTGDTTRAPVHAELHRGDALVLTSDGVLEAMNAHRQVFGFERFERAVAESKPEHGAAAVRESILAAMRAYGAGIPPHDDVTLLAIRVV